MPRNPSGDYTLPLPPVVVGTVIATTWANPTTEDIAAALTESLSRAGNGAMQAALRIVDGSAAVPGLAFNAETGSGLYRAGLNDVRMAIAGLDITRWIPGRIDKWDGAQWLELLDAEEVQDLIDSNILLILNGNNTWTGTNTFDNNVTINSGNSVGVASPTNFSDNLTKDFVDVATVDAAVAGYQKGVVQYLRFDYIPDPYDILANVAEITVTKIGPTGAAGNDDTWTDLDALPADATGIYLNLITTFIIDAPPASSTWTTSLRIGSGDGAFTDLGQVLDARASTNAGTVQRIDELARNTLWVPVNALNQIDLYWEKLDPSAFDSHFLEMSLLGFCVDQN